MTSSGSLESNLKKTFYGAWIDGAEVEAISRKRFEIRNPATGALVAHVAECEEEDVKKVEMLLNDPIKKGFGRIFLQEIDLESYFELQLNS
jgi:hypothetical protein